MKKLQWHFLTYLFPQICMDSKLLGSQPYRKRPTLWCCARTSAGPLPWWATPSKQRASQPDICWQPICCVKKKQHNTPTRQHRKAYPDTALLARLPQRTSAIQRKQNQEESFKIPDMLLKSSYLAEIASWNFPGIVTKQSSTRSDSDRSSLLELKWWSIQTLNNKKKIKKCTTLWPFRSPCSTGKLQKGLIHNTDKANNIPGSLRGPWSSYQSHSPALWIALWCSCNVLWVDAEGSPMLAKQSVKTIKEVTSRRAGNH